MTLALDTCKIFPLIPLYVQRPLLSLQQIPEVVPQMYLRTIIAPFDPMTREDSSQLPELPSFCHFSGPQRDFYSSPVFRSLTG